jgi:hypothetical protein
LGILLVMNQKFLLPCLLALSISALILTAGCGGKSDSNGTDSNSFKVHGNLSQVSGFSSFSDPKMITDVIAVSPSSHEQRLGTISGTSFSIDIQPGEPWIIVFVDRSRVGLDMIVGKFKSGVLDTIRPSDSGSDANLGTVEFSEETVTSSASAVPSISFDTLLAAIGMDSASAAFFGSMDDICLRYVNPDINNNGVLDVVEGLDDIFLDFHNRFQPRVNQSPVSISNLKNSFLPDSTVFQYTSTGVVFEISRDAFSVPSSYEFKFSNPVNLGNSTILARDTFHQQSYTDNAFYGRYQMFIETIVPPSGQYDVRVGGTTFTFSDVIVPDLSARDGFILPFIRFNVNEDETVSGISWKWMKKSGDTWVLATSSEVELAVAEDTGFVSTYIDGTHQNTNVKVGFRIGRDVTGTTSLSNAVLENISLSAASALTFNRYGHLGVSYDDTLGMRYFAM